MFRLATLVALQIVLTTTVIVEPIRAAEYGTAAEGQSYA